MDSSECYRLLELSAGASREDIKSAYRRLARRYHPDANPDVASADRFVRVTEAYRHLLRSLETEPADPPPARAARSATAGTSAGTSAETESRGTAARSTADPPRSRPKPRPKTRVRRGPRVEFNPDLSPAERDLKARSYDRLQALFAGRRWASAIALAEGLAQRLPQDPEVRQWQAIAYQRWAQKLVERRQPDKARLYLKKALHVDPHNRTLWQAVEREFRQIETLFGL